MPQQKGVLRICANFKIIIHVINKNHIYIMARLPPNTEMRYARPGFVHHPGDYEGPNLPWPEPMLGLEERNGKKYARFPVGKSFRDVRDPLWANCDPTMYTRFGVAPYAYGAAPAIPPITCADRERRQGQDGRMYTNVCDEVRPPCKWVPANPPADI